MVGEGFQLTEKSPPYFITSLFVGSFWDFLSQSTKNVLGRKKTLEKQSCFFGRETAKNFKLHSQQLFYISFDYFKIPA